MARALRIAATFVLVLATYGVYARVAVPLIEPAIERRVAPTDGPAIDPLAGRFKQLAALFPAGAWQLRQPKLLESEGESEQVKLLFDRYKTEGDKVILSPCTMIVVPEGPPQSEAARLAQAYVLEVPQEAVLEFDQTPDTRQVSFGKLIGGMLKGPIVIRTAGKDPGPEDDLRIATRDVQLTEREIWTPHDVEVRYGPNYALGREMHILLAPGDPKSGTKHGPSIGGLQSFELRQVERLYFAPQAAEAVGGRPAAASAGELEQLPVELSCQGRFFFDLPARRATFEDHVDVLRIHPNGPSDQLSCELLSVFLEPSRNPKSPPAPSAGKKNQPALPDLEAHLIVAEGNPVVVTAPSEQVHARGRRLEYDLWTGQISLTDDRPGGEVWIQQKTNEVHAPSLVYCPDPKRERLGTIVADGAGWLRGHMEDRPEDVIEAQWQRRLQVVPDGAMDALSLTGGAILSHRAVGRIDAESIHFWVAKAPAPAPGKPALRPDHMLADRNVHIRSPQITGALERLEMWFVQPPPPAPRDAAASQGTGAAGSPRPRQQAAGAETADGGWSWAHDSRSADPAAPQPHFEVTGRLLRACVLLREPKPELQELVMEQGLTIRQTQTSRPDEQPVFIGGDRVELKNASGPAATVVLVGRPAQFQGFGMGMTGAEIHIDRGANRLWIPGPGRLDLPIDRDMEGRPLARPVSLTIQWQQGMDFNGQQVRFEGGVVASTPLQRLDTPSLVVELAQPVNFADEKLSQRPDVRSITCPGRAEGDVRLVSRSFDEAGRQTSLDRLEAVNLSLDRATGEMLAGGPGWVSSVRYGLTEAMQEAPLARRPIQPASHEQAESRELRGLTIRFLRAISGNRISRRLTFHKDVQLAFAPAESWDVVLPVNDPERLGPKGITLRADSLSVLEMPVPMTGGRAIEVEASGNAIVESQMYTARALRITYAESADRLILEGDGRTPVHLQKQDVIGGPYSEYTGRKIIFWPKTKAARLEDATTLDINR